MECVRRSFGGRYFRGVATFGIPWVPEVFLVKSGEFERRSRDNEPQRAGEKKPSRELLLTVYAVNFTLIFRPERTGYFRNSTVTELSEIHNFLPTRYTGSLTPVSSSSFKRSNKDVST